MRIPLATQRLLGANTDKLDSLTYRLCQTLCWKASLTMVEVTTPGEVGRTFAIYQHDESDSAPHSDLHDARAEDERGESFMTEPHELSPLERQRESAGITADEDET